LVGLLRHDFPKTVAALGLAVLIGGLVYWTIPYPKLGTDVFWIILGGLGLMAGVAIARWIRLDVAKTAAVAGLGFVTSVMMRVIYDGLRDPTSHNLFFIEVAIAFVFGFVFGSLGALFGRPRRR
jgi:hypothetical protein